MKKSWQTKAGGLVLIATVIINAFKALTDNDPTTTVDVTTLLGQIAAGWAIFMARQNNVSSEDVGLKG